MQIDSSTIYLIIAVGAVVFNIFQFFNKPQESLEKKQATDKLEVESLAKTLAQQVQWEKEANEKKFQEVQLSIKDAFTLAQNHTHTVEIKVDALTESINKMNSEMVELRTIISERIPKK